MSKRNPSVLGQWGPEGTSILAAESYRSNMGTYEQIFERAVGDADAEAIRFDRLSEAFEEDLRQSLLEDDPGDYELPVGADGIAELSKKDIEHIVQMAAASLLNVVNGYEVILRSKLGPGARGDEDD